MSEIPYKFYKVSDIADVADSEKVAGAIFFDDATECVYVYGADGTPVIYGSQKWVWSELDYTTFVNKVGVGDILQYTDTEVMIVANKKIENTATSNVKNIVVTLVAPRGFYSVKFNTTDSGTTWSLVSFIQEDFSDFDGFVKTTDVVSNAATANTVVGRDNDGDVWVRGIVDSHGQSYALPHSDFAESSDADYVLQEKIADISDIRSNAAKGATAVQKSGDTMTGTLNTRALVPTADNAYNLGSSAYKYSDVFTNRLRCNLLTDDGTANGSYSKVLGLYAYAGVRTGNSTYPYAYLTTFPTRAFTVNGETVYGYILAPGESLTYTYNGTERTVTNPNASYCSVFAIINGGDDFCGTTTDPLRRATMLEISQLAYSYLMQIEVIGEGVQGVMLYTSHTTLTHSFAEAKNVLAFNRTASKHYSGAHSVASGIYSIASGAYSIASGIYSIASGIYSVASGYSSVASGAYSVASGYASIASHESSGVFASFGKSGRSRQTVFGSFNEGKSNTALEVGWGSSSARKNIFEVDTSGNVASTGTNTATKHITSGGTSSQFVKGNGSLDSTEYLPLTGGELTGTLYTESIAPATIPNGTNVSEATIGHGSGRYAAMYATRFVGTADKATSDASGNNIADTYATKDEIPTVPTKTSELTNDSGFATVKTWLYEEWTSNAQAFFAKAKVGDKIYMSDGSPILGMITSTYNVTPAAGVCIYVAWDWYYYQLMLTASGTIQKAVFNFTFASASEV